MALSHGDTASADTDDVSRVEPVEARSRLARAATAAVVLAGLNWAVWYALPHDDSVPIAAWAWTLFLAVNIGLMVSPTLKRQFVRFIQRWLLNPPIRALLAVGVVPLGWALIETTGRRTGKLRRTPVGNGLVGQTFWIVAEHGYDARARGETKPPPPPCHIGSQVIPVDAVSGSVLFSAAQSVLGR